MPERTSVDISAGRQWVVFYTYTAWSVIGSLVLLPLGVMLFLGTRLPSLVAQDPGATAVLAVQIVLAAWSGRRALSAWSRTQVPPGRDRWDLPRVGRLAPDWSLVLTAALSGTLAAAHLLHGADDRLLLISLALLTATALMRVRWEVGAAGAVALAGITALLGHPLGEALALGGLVLAVLLTIRMSLWLAAMVRELDDARQAQAQLAVAEERLRFARDLHDVTGRDLSVIAVKSELVAQLAEREDARAVEHARAVAQIARTSVAEIRALVRGYREVDLAAELRGTASLLRSAQAEVTVEGTAADVPARHAATAAWVLREGGTNILRHADPTAVTITLGPAGITLLNDGARGPDELHEGAGLAGMRERLGSASRLSVRREDGVFTLDVRFDVPGGAR